jgi:hypothetical protein
MARKGQVTVKSFNAEMAQIGAEWDRFEIDSVQVMVRIWDAADRHLDPEVVADVKRRMVDL